MARDNPTWGRRRIQAELALLGYVVAELTVSKYMHRPSPRPSPTWRAFLAAHAREIVGVDFFLVPTLTFRLLFVFVVLRHDRRELLHVNVTEHPTAAGPPGNSSRRSRTIPLHGSCSGIETRSTARQFGRRVKGMGIREILTAPRAPWQNPFVERVIGSIRRECLDHFLILSDAHLRRLLRAYLAYYNTVRPHQALDNNSPRPRSVQPSARGCVVAIPQVGGLHHLYQRAA